MALKDFTTEQLQKELEKRTANQTRPLPLNRIKWEKLVEACEKVMEKYAVDGYFKDDEHYIYEEAIDLIYGPKAWEWINEYNIGEI